MDQTRQYPRDLAARVGGNCEASLNCGGKQKMAGIFQHLFTHHMTYYDLYLVGGWPTPLKNDGVRQLGWWTSQYMET